MVNLLATCEALTLGAGLGLDVRRVLRSGQGRCGGIIQFEDLGRPLIEGNLEPGGTVETVQKDLDILMSAARDLHMSLPGSSLGAAAVQRSRGRGQGRRASGAGSPTRR